MIRLILLIALVAIPSLPNAQAVPKEEDYYKLVEFPIPEHVNLEAGGLELLGSGKLAISTRRGDIFVVDKPFADPPTDVEFTKFASGLHEVLGLAERDGWLYCTQRCEVTRMKDVDNDGRADLFENVSDGWEITGDYHEYAFGSNFDKDGN
ncbi:MAG: hypothetical protein IAF94_21395, partial [Pirellulaceae bacterium]|nr:hypothetical protein [Pirellulaceae bacterium]